MCLLVDQLCPTLYDPTDCSLPGSWDWRLMPTPVKNTGGGCHSLLQGIFPTRGLNPGLLHCRQILYQLSYYSRSSRIICDIMISLTLQRWFFDSFLRTCFLPRVSWKFISIFEYSRDFVYFVPYSILAQRMVPGIW